MPVSLPNTTITDAYPANPQVAGTDIFANGYFTVANNPVFTQYVYGIFGQERFSPEFYLAPSVYPIFGSLANPIAGIRFRNAVAGSPAQVFGAFFYKDDPVMTPSSEFLSTVSSTGTFTPPPTGAVQLISDKFLSIATANFDFTSIPQTFKHLAFLIDCIGDAGAVAISIRFNGDSGANYDYSRDGGAASAQTVINATDMSPNNALNADRTSALLILPNYAVAEAGHSILSLHTWATAASMQSNGTGGGSWKTSAAINRVTLFPNAGNFATNSRCSLYGVS